MWHHTTIPKSMNISAPARDAASAAAVMVGVRRHAARSYGQVMNRMTHGEAHEVN
jgi:hypothetical protein